MITKGTVDRLIRFDSDGLPVLSVYVAVGYNDLEAVHTRVNSLITQVRPLTEDPSLDRRARLSLRQDIERIKETPDFGRGTVGAVAVFACGEGGLFETALLPRKVRDQVVVDRTPYVRPMLAVLDEYHRGCVLVVNKESARVWELYQTEMREIEEVRGRILRKPDYAGWAGLAEYRVRNKADDLVKRHYRQTVSVLDELFRTEGYDLLIIGGYRDEVAVFLDFLPQQLRPKVAGTFNVDMGKVATVEEIRESAERIVADYEREEESRLVQEVFERAATGGNAAIGIDDCLWGGTTAAIDILLIQDGAEVPGVVCDESGWLARSGQTCPLCGGATRQVPDVLDELTETVINEGGSVEHVAVDTQLKDHITAAALRFRSLRGRDGPSGPQLGEAEVVAEGVTEAAVDPVRTIGGFLGELDAPAQQGLVRLAAVVRGEDEQATHRALGHQFADLPRGLLGHRRAARLLQQDLALRVTGNVDGQPAHEAQVDVGVDLQAKLADIEVKGLVLVKDVYLRVRDGVEHARHATGQAGRKLIQNNSVDGRYGWSGVRPHPGHREARRHVHGHRFLAVRPRRPADDVAEGAAEGSRAAEADFEADVRHTAVGLPQQEHRPLDTAALQVAVWRLAERGPKSAGEVRLRHMGDPGQGGNVQRLRVGAVHRVPCPEHPAIGLFHSTAHGAMTPLFPPSMTDPFSQ